MVKLLGKLLFLLIVVAILFYVVYFTPPPKSWAEAQVRQILAFFIPLLGVFTGFFYLFIKPFARCFCLGLGAMILVVLKSTDSFNLLNTGATIAATLLLASSFQDPLFIIPRSKRSPLRLLKSFRKGKKH